MKHIITLVIALLISISSFAQGRGINYKAVIKDGNGNIMANQNLKVKLSILNFEENSDYEETHTTTTDANGIAILVIGSGTEDVTGNFFAIDWASNLYKLKIEIDTEPYDTFVPLGTTTFKAVPYALSSADNLWQRNEEDAFAITEKVGIGTSEPESALHVISNEDDDAGIIIQSNTDDSSSILLKDNNGTHNKISSSYGGLTISRYYSGEEYLYLTQLEIQSNGDIIAPNTSNNPSSQGLITRNAGDNLYLKKGGNDGEFNIGIGTSEPESILHVESDNQSATELRVDSNIGNSSISLSTGRFTKAYNTISSSNGNLTISRYFEDLGEASLNLLEIKQTGQIIAPNSYSFNDPQALITKQHADSNYLSAGGNVTTGGPLTILNASDATSSWRFSTQTNGSLSIFRNGAYRGFFSASTGNYSSISDRRAKRNITALENGTLNKVMQLNPVSYLMKDQTGTKRNMGLISQEVREIFPSIAHYVEEQNLITLSYTELIPILIKALQEQQTIIDGQNSKIESQHSENAQQNQAIQSLLQRMNVLEATNN